MVLGLFLGFYFRTLLQFVWNLIEHKPTDFLIFFSMYVFVSTLSPLNALNIQFQLLQKKKGEGQIIYWDCCNFFF